MSIAKTKQDDLLYTTIMQSGSFLTFLITFGLISSCLNLSTSFALGNYSQRVNHLIDTTISEALILLTCKISSNSNYNSNSNAYLGLGSGIIEPPWWETRILQVTLLATLNQYC